MANVSARQYLIGGLVGAALATAATALAAENASSVQAVLWPVTMRLNIDGKMDHVAAENVEVLNYKGSAYVPLRYVAEKMGATVRYESDHPSWGRVIYIDVADDRDLFIRDPDGIIGMGNFYVAHGNRTFMVVQVKQFKDLPPGKDRVYAYFYDKEGNLLLEQYLKIKFEKNKIYTNALSLDNHIENVDISKTRLELRGEN
ncbi:MAG: hypothetical protein BLM47_12780 [Candidatus Reconcilbacillus cellulovorans]|uniref:Copper amine oxidase-like N-terminal domain-containing protein n=1 Tax=Candidatus Reconcilbacillus cellulovorans TaxID=1906605 RepID=A0A2A6DXE2_9BACL|nr:MAG: hypothetical protein BLM47_12780 [Candidatus Reconcilbacillus cellulovorans]